jgi:hypothetical protein
MLCLEAGFKIKITGKNKGFDNIQAPSYIVKAVDILDSTINQEPTMQKLYNPVNLHKKEVSIC